MSPTGGGGSDEKERRAQALRILQKRKRMAAAGLDWNPATAAGQRPYDVVSMGARLRASINHMNTILKRKVDRTDARVVAWSKFDTHCHKVHQGLIAPPRYEPGVDVSTVPGVPDSRLDALKVDDAIRREVGRASHALLVDIIYFQRTFREMTGLDGLDEREIAVIFRHALDMVARYYRLGEA